LTKNLTAIQQSVEEFLRESKEPVRRSTIATALSRPRKMIGRALHVLLRQGTVTRTHDAYWAHSELDTNHNVTDHAEDTIDEMINQFHANSDGILEVLPHYGRFNAADLPGYFVTPWALQPREINALKDNRQVISVNDIDAWVTNKRLWLRRERSDQHKVLRRYFGSPLRVDRLRSALSSFLAAIAEVKSPEKSRTGLSWIFSQSNQLHTAQFKVTGNRMIGYFLVPVGMENKPLIKKLDFGDGTGWMNETNPEIWINKSSIEGLRELQKFSQRDINHIKAPVIRIISSLSTDSNYDMNIDPLDRIDEISANIPLKVLLAENPSKDAVSTINRLDRLGVLQLGPLKLLSSRNYSSFQLLTPQFWNHAPILDTRINHN
jgi:hypothetical protein